MSKITEEQLKTVQDQQNKLQALLSDIGALEVRKHEFLHAQAVLHAEIEKTKADLEKEYGAVNINLNDGTYSKIEKDSEHVAVKSED